MHPLPFLFPLLAIGTLSTRTLSPSAHKRTPAGLIPAGVRLPSLPLRVAPLAPFPRGPPFGSVPRCRRNPGHR